jgi:hypothetical protein
MLSGFILTVILICLNFVGDDDDDFDVYSMVDNFLLMSYLIVDKLHDEHPTIIKDLYWGQDPNALNDVEEIVQPPDLNDVEVESYAGPIKRSAFSARSTRIGFNQMPHYQDEECTLQVDPDLLPKSKDVREDIDNNNK